MKAKVILAAIALVATVGVASAQNTNQSKSSESRKSCYVDANKNGVCDKHEDGSCKTGNGKGLQDGSGQGKGLRDGSGRGKGNGQGKGQGLRDGSGRANGGKGANFVDANKNGVCDRLETAKK